MKRRHWAIGLISLVLLMLLVGGGYFVGVHLPAQRAETAYVEGQRALEDNRVEAAVASWERAFAEQPGHPEAGLALFDAIAFFEPERGEEILAKLERAGLPEGRLLARRVELALEADQLEAARDYMDAIDGSGDPGFDIEYARLRVLLAEGKTGESLERLNELIQIHPTSREVNLLHGQILYATGSMLNRARAKTVLMDLLGRTDTTSFKAAGLLVVMPELPLFDADLERVVDHLSGHPFLEAGLQQLQAGDLRRMAVRIADHDPAVGLRLAAPLMDREASTPEDRVLYLSLAQAAGQWEEVEPTVQSLQKASERTASETLVLVRQDFLQGRNGDAIARLRAVLEKEPDNPAALQVLIDRMSQSLVELSDAEQLELLEMIAGHPGADVQLLLRAYGTRIERFPDQRESLIGEVIARFRDSDPEALGFWLIAMGEPAEALTVVPEGAGRTSLPAFSVRYEALAALGRHEAMDLLIESAEGLLSEFQQSLARARLAILKERDDEAARWLEISLEKMDAEVERGRLFDIAGMARGVEAREVQRLAYQRAFAGGLAFPRQHALAYLESLLNDDDLDDAKRFANYLRSLNPENPIYINNDCYLDVILERNLEEVILTMSDLVEDHPETSHFRVTLALAQLLAGYEEAAMKTLDESEVSLDLESPQSKFAFAMVLAGSGQRGMARNMIDSLDRDALLEVERQLLDRFLVASGEL
jgi:tetratricopeptide (TPR) repeat protein